MTETARPVAMETGDLWAPQRVILEAEVGSGAHGMAIAGRDDIDLMGVYVEYPEQVHGLAYSKGTYTSRTVRNGERSRPGDVDRTLYSLRHFAKLVCAGNPSVTMLLYQLQWIKRTVSGDMLLSLTNDMISMHTLYRYAGYLREQKARFIASTPDLFAVASELDEPLTVRHMSRVPKRPELVAAFGYDTKYASHALRLGYQGIELAETGQIRYPMTGERLQAVMEVKRGLVGEHEALERIYRVEGRLNTLILNRPLLPEPMYRRVNAGLRDIHERYWRHAFGSEASIWQRPEAPDHAPVPAAPSPAPLKEGAGTGDRGVPDLSEHPA